MQYQAHVNPELNLAFLTDPHTHVRVGTRVQRWGEKGSAIMAYTSARFSRHKGGIEAISEEVKAKNTDSAARLDKIVGDYGHASVMALAPLTISIENISLYTAARIHYLLEPGYMSQEASTRYIDFSEFKFHPIQGCKEVIQEASIMYGKLYQRTYDYLAEKYNIDVNSRKELSALQARTFDCVRYILPASLTTSLTIRSDARVISGLIALLRDNPEEKVIGDMLMELLIGNSDLVDLGYTPEADSLIRHTHKSSHRYDSDLAVLQYLQSNSAIMMGASSMESFYCTAYMVDHDAELVKNYLSLIFPGTKISLSGTTVNLLSDSVAEILYRYHNRHKMIGNKAQLGALMVEGVMDFGAMRDMNRHRSVNKVVPFLEKIGDMRVRPEFTICPHISQNSDLYELYVHALNSIYKVIQRQCSQPYQRYNVPLAHNCHYRISGSMDEFAYICELRSRNGGHLAYRMIAESWANNLSDATWSCYHFNKLITAVDPDSKTQFIDRS